jgi:periplasmic divalent cation tolerance protein
MKSAAKYRLVLVTAPNPKTARQLAEAALKARLVACANLVFNIESHYWWRGKIERGAEVLLLLKSTSANVDRLEKLILKNHPYETPEFLVVPIHSGNQHYLEWISQSCTASAKARAKKG